MPKHCPYKRSQSGGSWKRYGIDQYHLLKWCKGIIDKIFPKISILAHWKFKELTTLCHTITWQWWLWGRYNKRTKQSFSAEGAKANLKWGWGEVRFKDEVKALGLSDRFQWVWGKVIFIYVYLYFFKYRVLVNAKGSSSPLYCFNDIICCSERLI